ncbi:RrF2 family transcriptional regulator [Nocardia miyunensis]|uniref:RrF2 family transcriptional regulator n=1 Tax=Nocardia miyunensis TaxID=282684 RepID=UPI000831A436|nr:Rrf2 family transcriptional regulator [Nocardia miyunensis]
MRVSARSDYAIRMLVELAADGTKPLTCEAIASSQDIPYRFLKSVVRDLRGAGLVRSQRGCEGGYWLGRPAAEITVADIIDAVDGGVLSVHGGELGELTYAAPADRVADLWRRAETTVRDMFGGITLVELLNDVVTSQER